MADAALKSEIIEALQERMLSGGELLSMQNAIDMIIEWEQSTGVELDQREIMLAYWKACDFVIDSFITNARQTNDPRFDSEAEVAAWEAQRPSVKRRRDLLKRFAGFAEAK